MPFNVNKALTMKQSVKHNELYHFKTRKQKHKLIVYSFQDLENLAFHINDYIFATNRPTFDFKVSGPFVETSCVF